MSSEDVIGIFTIVVIVAIVFLITIGENKNEMEKQIEIQKVLEQSSILDQEKFYLKEMKTDNLISGNIKGSYLFIGGSVYGQLSENKYLNVVYLDNDKIIDNVTGVHKVTKFDIEKIEISTIQKNETPYYMYIDSSYTYCLWSDPCTKYKILIGKPRLFLPDGWVLLNN